MLESIVVGLIVGGAAAYAAWALTPAPTRTRLALRAATALGGTDAAGLKAMLVRRLNVLARAPAGGCADCAAHAPTPAERAARGPASHQP